MTQRRSFLKMVTVWMLLLVGIAALRPVSAKAAGTAKAREAYFNGTVYKNAVLTSVKTGKKLKLKKTVSVTITHRNSSTATVKYKGKSYTVARRKVSVGSMKGTNSKAFSKASAEKFVNGRKYTSRTKYLLWISLYSQHIYVFKGSKGKWKLTKSFICSTGAAGMNTTYGKYTIRRKQSVWYFNGVACAKYASCIPSGAIHSWGAGGFGVPRSHGCVRTATNNALYIYKNIPVGTAVVTM